MKIKKGLFIVNEGVDTSGKSSTSALVAKELLCLGIASEIIHPLKGDSLFIEETKRTRKILSEKTETFNCNYVFEDFFSNYYSMTLLNNIYHRVVPLLESGVTVLCDRYYYSHQVNQSVFGGDILTISQLFGMLPQPDMVFFFDISQEIALERILDREVKGAGDNKEFLSQAINKFRELNNLHSFIRIDGTHEQFKNVKYIVNEITKRMEMEI